MFNVIVKTPISALLFPRSLSVAVKLAVFTVAVSSIFAALVIVICPAPLTETSLV